MTLRKSSTDWTDEHISRFWEYLGTHEHRKQLYFSRLLSHSLKNFLRLIDEVKGSILDFGCGPGYLTEVLCGFPAEVFATDSSSPAVNETNARCLQYKTFKGAVLTHGVETPFRDDSFNFITLIETVEHLRPEAVQSYLREIHRILRPGGALLITTPNDEDLESAMIYCPFCDSEFHDVQHFQSFTATTLAEIVTRASFRVEFCEGMDLEYMKYVEREAPVARLGWKRKIRLLAGPKIWRMLGICNLVQRLRPFVIAGRHLVCIARK